MFTGNNKKEKSNNIRKVIVGSISILSMIGIIAIIMLKNGAQNNMNNRKLLVSTSTSTSEIDISNININLNLFYGNRSISCYNNESIANYGRSANVSCSSTGYKLTGCSSIQADNIGIRYGVYSDGNYCYSKHITNGKDMEVAIIVQARCCKANRGTLNMDYIKKNSGAININQCNSISCSSANQSATGSAITLNTSIYAKEFQGNYYIDISNVSSSVTTYGGNNANMQIGLFCGNIISSNTSAKYNLLCNYRFGNYVDSFGGYSSANCTSEYKLTACDVLHRPFSCAADSTNSYVDGSFIEDNTCYSKGKNHQAVARCCTIV